MARISKTSTPRRLSLSHLGWNIIQQIPFILSKIPAAGGVVNIFAGPFFYPI